ncbi:aminotransferase class V-fold PLP-dependent enzyme [Streptomyces sp. A7024]|uniref:Aminotransferase class V-fold PLP-dependent enzyme n=1 Tax=Streptomyces coryli TaxID=1128680 RepID=A0A6G4U5M7_9ACTN|nr:aminotransferase class V-fold PLP-dependent enzyme [Streptomyces coryli]NGN66597.1 aminotransferase class V-fold PLP-dependent enzyme [Streptomyces coryli]
MDALISAEFAPKVTHLDTAATGLLPARAAAALREGIDALTGDRPLGSSQHEAVAAARRGFARIEGVPEEWVSVGSSVSIHVGIVAEALPAGAEVLLADGDFSSLVTPFSIRPDLRVRSVPADRIADEVRPGTDLVAVSSVQFDTGRLADLGAIREAARTHGARTLIDTTQGVGWRPPVASGFDVTVCGAYKWLMHPRGGSYLTASDAAREWLRPLFPSWMAAADPMGSVAGGVSELSATARRYDQSPPFLPYIAGQHAFALIEELGGPERVGAHNTALADRFRAGLVDLGYEPAPAPGSAIVGLPGRADLVPYLSEAGIVASARGGLRIAFHLYNTEADADRTLEVLADARSD